MKNTINVRMFEYLSVAIASLTQTFNSDTSGRRQRFSEIDILVLAFLKEKNEPTNGLSIYREFVKRHSYKGANSTIYSSLYKLQKLELIDKSHVDSTHVKGGRRTSSYAISESGKRILEESAINRSFESIQMAH